MDTMFRKREKDWKERRNEAWALPIQLGESPIAMDAAFYSSVLRPKELDHIGQKRKQCECHQVLLQSSNILPKGPGHKDFVSMKKRQETTQRVNNRSISSGKRNHGEYWRIES